jgi:hypothetical protein
MTVLDGGRARREFGHNEVGVVDTSRDERLAGYVASPDDPAGAACKPRSHGGQCLIALGLGALPQKPPAPAASLVRLLATGRGALRSCSFFGATVAVFKISSCFGPMLKDEVAISAPAESQK